MFTLDKAQEQEQQQFAGIPANTDLKVRIELQGPNEKMGEVVAPGAPNTFWVQRADKSGVSQKTNQPYTIPGGVLVRPKLVVTGSKDGKYINANIFADAFVQGGNPEFTSAKGNTVASESQRGQDFLWALLCAANGVSTKSPEGQALRGNPQIETLNGKEIAVRTAKPDDRGNSTLGMFAAAQVYGVGDARYAQVMQFQGKQAQGGFGGMGQQPMQQAQQQQTGGFGNVQQNQPQTTQHPAAGGMGNWA